MKTLVFARPVALLALGMLGFAGCESVIDVPEPPHTPSLAVRYALGTLTAPDSVTQEFLGHRQLFVSASQRLFDTRPLRPLTNAVARLYDDGAGGALVEEFRAGRPYGALRFGPDTAGYYVPTRGFVPQPGGTYRLRVEAPDYPAVESRLTLPAAAPQILSATFTPRVGTGNNDYRGRLVVTIADDPAATNYYTALARVLDAAGQPIPYGYVTEVSDDNAGPTNVRGSRLMLSSAYGSGDLLPYAAVGGTSSFTLNADLSVSIFDPQTGLPLVGAQLEVVISRLSFDTYQFWLSSQR